MIAKVIKVARALDAVAMQGFLHSHDTGARGAQRNTGHGAC